MSLRCHPPIAAYGLEGSTRLALYSTIGPLPLEKALPSMRLERNSARINIRAKEGNLTYLQCLAGRL
jgi:hypothetical protein